MSWCAKSEEMRQVGCRARAGHCFDKSGCATCALPGPPEAPAKFTPSRRRSPPPPAAGCTGHFAAAAAVGGLVAMAGQRHLGGSIGA